MTKLKSTMAKSLKNKPAKKATMLDFIKENQSDSPLAKQTEISQHHVDAFKYTEEYMEQVETYNSNLTTIDPLYSSMQPLHEILVRFYLHEPIKVGELINPYKEMVPIETKSGIGGYNEVETDYPFTNKAVVIAAPESNQLKPGDTIMCSRRAVQLRVIGNGANAKILVDQGFVHPDSKLHDIPTNVDSQHYGYALIQYHEIKAKL